MELYIEYRIGYKQINNPDKKRKVAKLHILIIGETHPTGYCAGHEEFHHFLKVCFLGNNNLINNLKMKEKIKNQRSAGKIIPLHSKFTELTNDVSKDTGVLYGQKRKEVRHAELG